VISAPPLPPPTTTHTRTGDAGTKFEGMSVEDGVALIMKVLREAYPSIDVPDPLQVSTDLRAAS
jgi:hypothetical protein